MLSRRRFIQGGSTLLLAGGSLGAYAGGIEPALRLDVTTYNLTPPGWPPELELKCGIIADIHACEPWMPVDRIREIVSVTNALAPDIVFILGDFNAGHKYVTRAVYPQQWGEALSHLKAPLGAYAILGNHDWWHGALVKTRSDGAESIRRALRHANISLLENHSVSVSHRDRSFWVAGLADQMAIRTPLRHGHRGYDDLEGTLSQVSDDAPVLLLAHEPYIFDRVPKRVSLTLCGHTHGGQVNLPILSHWWETHRMGTHHVYGHIVEDDRHMIISAGLGTSIAPIRFMRPPEVVLVKLGGSDEPAPTV